MRIRNFVMFLCICGIVILSGCQENQKNGTQQLTVKKEAKDSTAKLKDENTQLKKQIETLMGLNKEARAEALSTLIAVEVTKKSGLYTKDETGKKERLVVYLKPIDDMGDVVKAAGAAEVELWNLNAKPETAKLGQWKVEPVELKKTWTSTFMSTGYKLQFDVGSILKGDEKELTVKTQFTDYLTGKVFNSQVVINK